MKTLDKGHQYTLDSIDGGLPQHVTFVKREGFKYPGNVGHYGGTQNQEVMRMLIARAIHVNNQEPHKANEKEVERLRLDIYDLEKRAAERHGLGSRFLYEVGEELDLLGGIEGRAIELLPTCKICGHIVCHHVEPIKTSIYGRDWRVLNIKLKAQYA